MRKRKKMGKEIQGKETGYTKSRRSFWKGKKFNRGRRKWEGSNLKRKDKKENFRKHIKWKPKHSYILSASVVPLL